MPRRRRRREETLSKLREEVVRALGLDVLRLSESELRELCDIILSAVSSSSRASRKVLVSRLYKRRNRLAPIAVNYFLERHDALTEEETEYCITMGGKAVIPYTQTLYYHARKYGRSDLIGLLRELWVKEGYGFPIICPSCVFPSIPPSLECVVCGYRMSEEELRDVIGFRDLFEVFLETASVEQLKEALNRGMLFYNNIYGLSSSPSSYGICYPIPLTPEEERAILRRLRERRGERGG